ncbi:schlafen family member 12-like [Mus caroli]|uniref:Schlafen family member 12-like n=1 Tax=Mus caroli TaxID=10089 RepID=A0A6P7RHC0_MUSCR|nr:schlafen family member 12-like [Mus caroli]XP_029339168.1 schlafen family member 12-like [Mus caroli]XP_029339169.1 schlafen family member 12-like [Mus caroli]
MDSKQLRFQDKNLKSERVEKLSEGEMAGNTPQLEKDVNPQTSTEPSVQLKCPGDILQGGRHAKPGRWMASWKGFHLGSRDSDCKMSITVDQDTDYAELVLSVGEITLGEKTRDSMKDSQLRSKEAKSLLQAVCTLLNSGGGVVKAHIKNQNYSFTRDGMGLDLVYSLPSIVHLPHDYLDFMQHKDYFFIFVKPWKPNQRGPGIATWKTNLYIRIFSFSVELKAVVALQFLKSRTSSGKIICNETLKECLTLFNRDWLAYGETFCFTKSTHAEVKLTPKEKISPKEKILEFLPQTVSAFANTEGGYLFIGLDGKTQQIIGFEAEKSDLLLLESEIEKCIQQLPVTHFCGEKEKIKYTCKFIEVHKSGAVCAYVCALRVERFCCAVFAAEPESWHVEGGCVKRFTTEEWVKHQMDATAEMPGKLIRSPEALCMKPFSLHEGYEHLVRTELGSLRKGTLVISKSWALNLGLQEKQEVIWDVLHISQGGLLTLYVFVQGDENLEGNSSLLGELGAELKGYYKQIALTLKQTLLNHCGYTAKIGIIVKITYLGHKTMSLYDSSAKIRYPQKYYLTTKAVKDLEIALAEILGSCESFYSLPRRNWDSFMSAFLNVGSYIVSVLRNVLTHIRI